MRILLLTSLLAMSLTAILDAFPNFPRQCPERYSYYLYEQAARKTTYLRRKHHGVDNNFHHPNWGKAKQPLSRVAPSSFDDFRMYPSGEERPSAREISNLVCSSTEEQFQPDPKKLSGLFLVWGQFFTHDLHHTPPQEGEGAEKWSIPIPKGDPHFDPNHTGNITMSFTRSIFDQRLHDYHPRQQLNLLSSWFDGELIYGGSMAQERNIRSFEKGKVKLDSELLLPKNQKGMFVSGDSRVNENIVLTSMNTLFAREHNRIAENAAALFPFMSDDDIFIYAKNCVIALICKITYDDYLPLLLGQTRNLQPYNGYDPEVDPAISNVFSTVALRYGHFTVPFNVLKMNDDGQLMEKIKVRDSIRNPSAITKKQDIGQILNGQAHNPMKKRSVKMSDELRNFLVSAPDKRHILLDLAAINIQRGRDHGLPDYNTFRRFMGLKECKSFEQVTSDRETVRKLKECYKDISLLDAFIGIIAQESLPGASIGQLGAAIIKQTMQKVRKGDRFWYEDCFPPQILKEIKETSLADIIRRNTEIKSIHDNVFIVPE